MSMADSYRPYERTSYPEIGRASPPHEHQPTPTTSNYSYAFATHSQHPYFVQNHNPKPPPSPPMDKMPRYSLPPISSLLNYSGSISEDWNQHGPHSPAQHSPKHCRNPDLRPRDRHQPANDSIHHQARTQFPPTPPTAPHLSEQPTSPVLTQNSRHTSQSETGPYFVEPRARRQSLSSNGSSRREYQTHGTSGPPNPAHAALAGEGNTRPLRINPRIYPATAQRALPTDFPPQSVLNGTLQTPNSSTSPSSPPAVANPWQQHQYVHPHPPQGGGPATSSFSPTQDRYICPTCSKAFSRPSSLRIHSHSHTGEKPFKCPHRGCGKAFSVRSNMKRHERGCHVDRRTDMNMAGRGRELLPAAG